MKKRLAIITSSDSCHRGERDDKSGPEICRMGEEWGWSVVFQGIYPDEQNILAEAMAKIADEDRADLILTTGGTGFSPRDVTPEATAQVCSRMCPGISEAMRAYSMQFTKRAMLSRGLSGIRGKSLIINLPGSPKAVKECLEFIFPELEHGLEILQGDASRCGDRKC